MTRGLAADLGYTHATGNPVHRVVRWGARPAARFYPGHARYRQRVGQRRRVRVFVLRPA